jgi:hypothetical protein
MSSYQCLISGTDKSVPYDATLLQNCKLYKTCLLRPLEVKRAVFINGAPTPKGVPRGTVGVSAPPLCAGPYSSPYNTPPRKLGGVLYIFVLK